jgi:hypothetical protein
MRKLFSSFAALLLVAVLAHSQSLPFPGPGAGAGGPPGPGTIANLKAQWEADCITFTSSVCGVPADGTSITAWADESGNANDLTKQAGTCTFHTNQVNTTHPAVTFTTACYFTTAATINLFGGKTLFVVIKLASNSGAYIFSGASASFSYWAGETQGGTARQQGADRTANTLLGYGTATADTNWHQMNVVQASGSVQPTFRRDRATDTRLGGSANVIVVGNNNVGRTTQSIDGQIAALIVYDRDLTAGEITTVETYLNSKYGL